MLLFRQLFDDPVSAHYGIPEHIVCKMGNSKDRRMLDRYAHLADETLREAEARLAARLNGTEDGPNTELAIPDGTPRPRSPSGLSSWCDFWWS